MKNGDSHKILSTSFFDRPTLTVARELLGKFLVVRQEDGTEIAVMICETEAYDGPEDRASHAFRGKTKRTNVMFGAAGVWYIYLIYGMYWMLNIVTGPEAYPAAVLIRAVGDYTGPGKLTKALRIDKRFHEKPASRTTGLWIEDRGEQLQYEIKQTPRIGVDYAGPHWSQKEYRFLLVKKTNLY